ncbi:histidinol-phosphate transaminase [Nakamurella silvestris]|nr:histidinol-phosphate transaminase [Nakamurella silvestris]
MSAANRPHTREALAALPAYTPGRTVPGAIKLASNEMPFPPLASVAAAITAAALEMNRYPDNGAQALVGALADRLAVDPAQIVVGCGSVSLCEQLVQATCTETSEVIFGWRSFEAYPIIAAVVGARAVPVPVTAEESLDLDAMAAAITPATRLIFVCNPNNPTGTALTAAELETFLAKVPSEVLVVVDEAYREFIDDETIPDGVEFARGRTNVVVLRTLSKAYGLAGLRVGYSVSDPEVAVALRKVAIPFAVSSVAQAAALASLAAADELLDRCRIVVAERHRVRDELIAGGYTVPTTQANFVWLPLRDNAAGFAAHCEDHAIIVRPFNDAANGGVRITIGSAAENTRFLAAAAAWTGPRTLS